MSHVRVAHLLIKHNESRNPISRRTNQTITISPDEAQTELFHYMNKIRQEGVQESFYKYATERSDCSSYARHGDLGTFGRGAMQKPFEDAAFALEIGEMSEIISTDSGFHLIYRIS